VGGGFIQYDVNAMSELRNIPENDLSASTINVIIVVCFIWMGKESVGIKAVIARKGMRVEYLNEMSVEYVKGI
jgi:hypothetical protein